MEIYFTNKHDIVCNKFLNYSVFNVKIFLKWQCFSVDYKFEGLGIYSLLLHFWQCQIYDFNLLHFFDKHCPLAGNNLFLLGIMLPINLTRYFYLIKHWCDHIFGMIIECISLKTGDNIDSGVDER